MLTKNINGRIRIRSVLPVFAPQRLPNGSIDAHDDGNRVSELQELLDRTNKELTQSREHSAALNARMAELEAELANARRELSRSEELSLKQQREQREVRGKDECAFVVQAHTGNSGTQKSGRTSTV